MKIGELISVLERFAPPELQEEYDNAGLITGERSATCTGVLCTLDVTEEVLEEALANNCNLIIAHHPIVFKGLKRFNGKNSVERTLIKAIRKDIAIYAAHTNLDNVVAGVNGKIAALLGLAKPAILQPKPAMLRRLITFAPGADAEKVRKAVFAAGAGHIGQYEECSFNSEGTGTFKAMAGAQPYVGQVGERHYEKETKIEIVYPFFLEKQVVKALVASHPYEEVAYDIFTMDNVHFGIGAGVIGDLESPLTEAVFLETLAKTFHTGVIRHTSLLGRPIRKVAVCGGSGAFLIKQAVEQGADVYVTADVKYHEFFEADGRLVIADIGHFESEQFTSDLVRDLLLEKFPTFAVLKSKVNTNPVSYFTGKNEL
ncbi:MAG TPA: Nif3-like dinuclear metal center hexameric protein [Flavisolibacter sp.]|nr:Nif3-like dinuclear metal center hexameric protein [Flavisolibacter sp.]